MRRLLTKQEAANRVGYHPEHLMRLSREGLFPKAVKMGQTAFSAIRFVEDEVDAWIEQKLADR
jgi:predicted DNA-binding transcriptional regulator AlpA